MRVTGSVGSVGGFLTAKLAEMYRQDLECDRRRGNWIDPSGFQTKLSEWVQRWWSGLDLDLRTLENYESYLRIHILPRFGTTAMGDIAASDIRMWKMEAAKDGYASTTISSWVNLLSMILTDAMDERLIAANPVKQMRRRGRRSLSVARERVWATPWQVHRLADQAGELGGPTARLMIITAAWTGCRWGELAGLHRRNVDLQLGVITIDKEEGALHESGGKRWIGPPKTPWSARTIHLPPFLIGLLRQHLAVHPYDYVFTTPTGKWLWRSTFTSRIFRPAADGNQDRPRAVVRTKAVAPGLTFHGLRHSHKTWLIGNGDPETAQSRRLGHHLDNRVVETYSHVEDEVRARLLAGLEERWRTSFGKRGPKNNTTRHVPVRRKSEKRSGTQRRRLAVADSRPRVSATTPATRRPTESRRPALGRDTARFTTKPADTARSEGSPSQVALRRPTAVPWMVPSTAGSAGGASSAESSTIFGRGRSAVSRNLRRLVNPFGASDSRRHDAD
ncbi:MAG TPA: tyrosine-type recombinase/integrase [Pseudonocardiaceae bacterium]|nr:tyrosine-type recombinase/integrase [Pseudonocardiaceae bacterium]